MKINLITAPAIEPLTYFELAYHMRLTVTSLDEVIYIKSLIETAREYCEDFQGRKYISQVYDYFLDEWPEDEFVLPYGEVISCSGIYYTDTDESETEFASTNYLVDTDSVPGRVVLGYNKTFPTTTLSPKNPIRIRFTTGYGTASKNVPAKPKQAIKILVSDMYENREDNVFGVSVNNLKTAERLLYMNKVWRI